MTDVAIPEDAAAGQMKALNEAMEAIEAKFGSDPTVVSLRKVMCTTLSMYNEHAEKSGAKPLDGGGNGK